MTDSKLMGKFLEALEFAAYRHRFDKSKNEEPYINHIIKVCALLIEIGKINDPEILVAAALHDILEKTSTKPKEISILFGDSIYHLVMELTDFNFVNETERWQQQLEKAVTMSWQAKVIKLADKIANVESVLSFPPEGWNIERRIIYLEWAEKIISVFRGINEGLENYFYELMKEGRRNHLLPDAIPVNRVA